MLEFINAILHIDATLIQWAQEWGPLLYGILFLIIFCETGLVVTPFLPGDSLLFAAGALAARPEFLKIETLIPLLITASILGDSLNYFIGRNFGRALFEKNLFFLKREYLTSTEIFFEKRGVWAVSISRFFPIIRTMAPFFAGMSLISYKKFLSLSVLGSIAWVFIFCLAGYFFGQIEIIKNNFTALVMALILIPGIPFLIGVIRTLRAKYLLKKNTQNS